jgi:hypothetical protein
MDVGVHVIHPIEGDEMVLAIRGFAPGELDEAIALEIIDHTDM